MEDSLYKDKFTIHPRLRRRRCEDFQNACDSTLSGFPLSLERRFLQSNTICEIVSVQVAL